jgi:dinuclear metal center YbgI/SA1388 family protein
MKCGELIKKLEETYPPHMAAAWDNSGLVVGDRDQEVKTVYVAVDATDQVIEAAKEKKADLILTHHPMLFSSVKKVNTDDFTGRRIVKLLQDQMSCYAMHTNFDVVTMGSLAADMLRLQDTEVLEVTFQEGEQREGFGRTGMLPHSMTLQDCAAYVKETFGLESVKVFGDLNQEIKRVGVLPGSGKSTVESAIQTGAQVLITGDFGHHEGIDALMQGLSIIDAGHYGIEHIFIPYMVEKLKMEFPELTVYGEEICNPFRVL